jgi:hypothetical protein
MKEYPFKPGSFYAKGYTREGGLSSVGEGWAGLVNEAFDKLEKLTDHVVIDQVKEKYGGLRIYTSPYHDEFEKVIQELEVRSFTICEDCGKPGALRGGGWYRTLCDEHAGNRPKIEPF